MPQVIDLFCGVGGLTRGLIDAGLDVIAGFDIDETCKYTYEHNNNVQYYLKNIKEVLGEDLLGLYNSDDNIRILVGCAPCQPFSQLRSKLGEANEKDEKYDLLLKFGRLIQDTQPATVSMENVPQIKNTTVFNKFLNILKEFNYHIDTSLITDIAKISLNIEYENTKARLTELLKELSKKESDDGK